MPTIARPRTNPAHEPAQVATRLRRADGAFRARWIVLAVLGFTVLWIGPLLFAGIAWAFQVRHYGRPSPFGVLFAWSCAISIPILFLLEWATRGAFLQDSLDAMDTGSFVGNMTTRRAAGHAVLIEVCLWGPRMIIAGSKRVVGDGRITKADREGGARVLAPLLRREEGMDSGQLFAESGLDEETFGGALSYLTFHDRIGISKDGMRIWVLSDARRRLEK